MAASKPTAAFLLAALLLSGCSGNDPGDATGRAPDPLAQGEARTPDVVTAPALDVQVITRGLEHGWDVGFLPDGQLLVAQRPARLALVSKREPGATVRQVQADLSSVYVRGEGGLLGMVVHPDFDTSRQFTTCQTHQQNGRPVDVRLVTWQLAADGGTATKVKDLLTGLPIADSGRHSGCRPTLARDGALIVGTGDTARGGVPQDRASLGGKTLRLDLKTGEPLPDNPFISSPKPRERFVYTYGHRNVQGIALRPGSAQVYSAEHGPDNNDEVNLLRPGANYGWDPAQGGTRGGYDESVPMTDLKRFPDAVPAVWESGETTQAICAAAFLDGKAWGKFDGALVVTALKGAKLLVLSLDPQGKLVSVAIPAETNGPFGRLRAARAGPDGALYLTTTNGEDDALLRIMPRG